MTPRLISIVAVVVTAAALATSASGSSQAVKWFVTPGKNVNCEMGLKRPGLQPRTYVFCLAYRDGNPERTARAVSMNTSGKLKVCRGCMSNSDGPITLKVGHSIALGPFLCTSLRPGVRCIVKRSRHGFRLSLRGLRRF
jgi:hypothetical protein